MTCTQSPKFHIQQYPDTSKLDSSHPLGFSNNGSRLGRRAPLRAYPVLRRSRSAFASRSRQCIETGTRKGPTSVHRRFFAGLEAEGPRAESSDSDSLSKILQIARTSASSFSTCSSTVGLIPVTPAQNKQSQTEPDCSPDNCDHSARYSHFKEWYSAMPSYSGSLQPLQDIPNIPLPCDLRRGGILNPGNCRCPEQLVMPSTTPHNLAAATTSPAARSLLAAGMHRAHLLTPCGCSDG